jgi:hypothetical protein
MLTVVGAIVELMSAVSTTFPEHEGVSQSGSTRRDMHRSASGEIKPTHLENPSRRIPRPARNWVVDNCGPDEHEDNAGQHSASLSDGTDCQSNPRNSVEFAFNEQNFVITYVIAANIP